MVATYVAGSSCGSAGPLVGFSAAAGGAVCEDCREEHGGFGMTPDGLGAAEALVARPLGEPELTPRQARDAGS